MCLSLISLSREAASSESRSLHVVAPPLLSALSCLEWLICALHRRKAINQWAEAAFRGSGSGLVAPTLHTLLVYVAGWGQWDWRRVCWIGMLKMEERRGGGREGGNLPGGNFWVRKLLSSPLLPPHLPLTSPPTDRVCVWRRSQP